MPSTCSTASSGPGRPSSRSSRSRCEYAVTAHVDHKTALQELLAPRGLQPVYRLVEETGPAHARIFTSEVRGRRGGARPGHGHHHQDERAGGGPGGARPRCWPRPGPEVRWLRCRGCMSVRLRGFKTFAKPTELAFEPGVTVIIGPERQRQEQHRRRRAVGAGRAESRQPARPQHAGRHLLRSRRPPVERGGRGEPGVRQRAGCHAHRRRPGGDHPAAGARQRLRVPGERQLVPSARRAGPGGRVWASAGRCTASSARARWRRCSTPRRRPAGPWWKRRPGWAGSRSGGSGRRPSSRRPGRTCCAWPTSSARSRAPCGPCASRRRRRDASRRPRRSGRWPRAASCWPRPSAVREAAGRTEAELQALERDAGGASRPSSPGCGGSGPPRRTGSPSALQEREQVGAVYHRLAVEAEQVQGKATSLRQRVARIEADLDRARRRRETARADVESLGRRLAEVDGPHRRREPAGAGGRAGARRFARALETRGGRVPGRGGGRGRVEGRGVRDGEPRGRGPCRTGSSCAGRSRPGRGSTGSCTR